MGTIALAPDSIAVRSRASAFSLSIGGGSINEDLFML